MQRIDPQVSKAIGMVSFICALLVVFIHVDVAPSVGTWQLVVVRIMQCLEQVAVPFFFLVSGFFLAGRMDEKGWYAAAVQQRVRSLLLPFYLWLILYQLFNSILVMLADAIGVSFGAETFSLTAENMVYLCGLHPFKLAPVVWYLRSLFLLVLLSAMLPRFNKVALVSLCVVAYGCWMAHEMRSTVDSRSWLFFEYFLPLRGICCFSVGVFIRRFVKLAKNRRIMWLMVGGGMSLSGVTLIACGIVALSVIKPILVVSLMIFIWEIAMFLVSREVFSDFLQKYCMPVYLMHMPWLIFFSGVLSVLGIKQAASVSLVAYVLKGLLAVALSIFGCKLLPRRLSLILFGGRT